jgi:hypothetical protein
MRFDRLVDRDPISFWGAGVVTLLEDGSIGPSPDWPGRRAGMVDAVALGKALTAMWTWSVRSGRTARAARTNRPPAEAGPTHGARHEDDESGSMLDPRARRRLVPVGSLRRSSPGHPYPRHDRSSARVRPARGRRRRQGNFRRLAVRARPRGGRHPPWAPPVRSPRHSSSPTSSYMYAGDTALHMAAAAFKRPVAEVLVRRGADCRARNRRAGPHCRYAADASHWDRRPGPKRSRCVISVGADRQRLDDSSVAPITRPVRTRSLLASQGASGRRGERESAQRSQGPRHSILPSTAAGAQAAALLRPASSRPQSFGVLERRRAEAGP